MGADMLLSCDGYPASTASVVGVHPEAELAVTERTAKDAIKRFCFSSPDPTLGFLSYSYGMALRGIHSTKPSEFPHGYLKKYRAVAEFNDGRAVITSRDDLLLDKLADRLDTAPEADVSFLVPGLPESDPNVSLNGLGYKTGVGKTLERILSGHTYQLNLSIRFSWRCPRLAPLSLFLALRQKHPAPFYAWLTCGNKRVLSTSPERFLRVEDGQVLSQPIKGTLRFDQLSPDLVKQLTDSPKEAAELSMIVDLIRNDISANCEYGSVRVANHKSVFAVDNLLQMYADVTGSLRPGRDCLDLFFDAFPGGSVTGCPKKRSMEIIEELEPHSRGIFCGSVVVIRDESNMDSSIAIRTATFDTATKRLDTYAGSGIVVDSDPAREYQETMAKAEKFLALGER